MNPNWIQKRNTEHNTECFFYVAYRYVRNPFFLPTSSLRCSYAARRSNAVSPFHLVELVCISVDVQVSQRAETRPSALRFSPQTCTQRLYIAVRQCISPLAVLLEALTSRDHAGVITTTGRMCISYQSPVAAATRRSHHPTQAGTPRAFFLESWLGRRASRT